MTEIFLQAKEGGSGIKSAESRDAIVGEGFFQIQMPDGGLAYTRNGSFKLASDGRVVTRDGFQLLGGMPPIPPETTGVVVTAPGVVFVSNGLMDCACGRISLVRFANPAALKLISSDLFIETEASGPPETGNPGENGFGEIGPGFFRLPGSFGFTTQLAPARSWIDVEVSQDAKTWMVLASGVSAGGEKLFVRDLRAADFEHRFYRVRSKPYPLPPANSQ
jgi:flagellar hook protein FlgE